MNLLLTNYEKGIHGKEIDLDLKPYSTGNDFENEFGTVIHIFDSLPFMRNIPANKGWFKQNIYHFN